MKSRTPSLPGLELSRRTASGAGVSGADTAELCQHDGSATGRRTCKRAVIEVNFLAGEAWYQYASIEVPAGEAVVHRFPDGFATHWVRVTADTTGTATVWFTYE